MVRIDQKDKLRARDYIPPLLLRLGREQECYNFLKWSATLDDGGGDGRDGDEIITSFGFPQADAFEPLACLRSGELATLGFNQLVSLTLLKLRLRWDLEYTKVQEESGGEFDEEAEYQVGELVRTRLWYLDVEKAYKALYQQYCQLFRVVHDANPHFWRMLAWERYQLPQTYRPLAVQHPRGSIEEAHTALYHCQKASAESGAYFGILTFDTRAFELTGVVGVGVLGATPKLAKTRGTGKVFPKVFDAPPPTIRPVDVFQPTTIPIGRDHGKIRLVCWHDLTKLLVYTDGACANNGQPGSQAGWAVIYGPTYDKGLNSPRTAWGRLEDQGPFGDESVHTSNRAELRAVIGALRLSDWRDEGFESIVIATDSTYVVNGATDWAVDWVRCDWKTRTGKEVKNRDLWELLLGEVERWSERGLRVELWKIPRNWNKEADGAAKHACRVEERRERFRDIFARS